MLQHIRMLLMEYLRPSQRQDLRQSCEDDELLLVLLHHGHHRVHVDRAFCFPVAKCQTIHQRKLVFANKENDSVSEWILIASMLWIGVSPSTAASACSSDSTSGWSSLRSRLLSSNTIDEGLLSGVEYDFDFHGTFCLKG